MFCSFTFFFFFLSFMYCRIIRFTLKNYSLFCKERNPKKVPENRKSPFGIPTKGFKYSRNVYQTVFPFLCLCFPRKPSKIFSFFFFFLSVSCFCFLGTVCCAECVFGYLVLRLWFSLIFGVSLSYACKRGRSFLILL